MDDTVGAALQSPKQVDRRTFFKRFAQVAGVLVVGSGACTLKPSAADAFFSFGPKIDPRWKGLVSHLKEYVTRCYVKYDAQKAKAALAALGDYGIGEDDVSPLQNVNRCLISKGMFLTYFYVESPVVVPAVKLFTIARRDVFAGYVVEGSKRNKLFGITLDDYERVLLGEEIFSTVAAPPVALPYNLAPQGSSKPGWVIAIPQGWIHDLYGTQAPGLEDRLIEELTIHEIAHIVHKTRDELIPFLAQFGYRVDEERPLVNVDNLLDYLRSRRLTYHQAERLILERIYYADAYYGSSGHFSHMSALKQIKEGIIRLSEEVNGQDPSYPKNILRISDQQCHASMAVLYHGAVQKLAMIRQGHGLEQPFG
jgi:hypothetical protein